MSTQPLRILRVLTRPNVGGPTQQVIALWHAMRAQRVSTVLVVGRCGPDEESVDLGAAGIPRVELGSRRDAVWTRGGGYLEVPPLGRSVRGVGDLRAMWQLRRLITSLRPDVLHTHTSKAGALGRLAALGCAARNRPVVVHTWHGHVLRDHLPRAGEVAAHWFERRLASWTDLHIAVGTDVARELREFGIAGTSDRLTVIPPAVETEAFAQAKKVPSQALRPTLGFVGRLVKVKRPGLFLDVVRECPGFDAILCGDGPLRSELEAAVRDDVRLQGRVVFAGALARPTLAECIRKMSVLVTTSRREGYPLAVVEALAAGVEVVGFDRPGLGEVLRQAECAVVAEQDGVAGLAAAAVAKAGEVADRESVRDLVAACAPAAVAEALVAAYRDALDR